MSKTEALLKELSTTYSTLGELPRGNPEGLMTELDYANQWLARSSEIVAEAEEILTKRRGDRADHYASTNVTATYLRVFLARDCVIEEKVVSLAKRLVTTLTHRIESVRSLLSYEKTNQQHSGRG
jgi:hypothetical protein